ncbi:MAG TPA: DMT family transporter [Gemmatimonadales bacterium]
MKARLQLVLAALCFSTAGAAIKWCAFGPAQIAAIRALVAMLAILVLIPQSRRGWSWRVAGVGVGYAAAGLLFVFANKLTTAANTVFLQATNPLFVVVLAPWLLGEPVTRADVRFMGVLALGLALLFVGGGQRQFATAPQPLLGNVLAAGSAVAWAFTVTGYRWLARQGGAGHGPIAAAAACGNLIVFLACLPAALPLATGRPTDWVIVIYLGVFQLGLAYVFLSRGITRVPALEASLFLLVEPVLSPVWAWLAHGETPGPLAAIGGVVILAATALKSWRDTAVVAA